MTLKEIKRNVRRFGHRIGIWSDWEHALAELNKPGEEKPSSWYDEVYAESNDYKVPYYRSHYYATWTLIADRLLHMKQPSVLDIGCGPGQFASLLRTWGLERYLGVDFSEQAIAYARELNPHYRFIVADLTKSALLAEESYNCVVCMEVLEHIEGDLDVIARVRPGTRCLCTVPNFPYISHVRHFKSKGEVTERYSHLFSDFDVTAIKGSMGPDDWYFLIDGTRADMGFTP